MKSLTQVARIIVGVLFTFSGFVKLVDPIGSQYKFEEYFSQSVLDMEYLIPYALPLSIILIIAETLLGSMLLIGYKRKFTLRSLLILTVLFLFLTWYSAYYNKVTDCGCFGDAIKLSPWETFYKNIILIILILFLILKIDYIKNLFTEKISKISTFLLLASFLFVVQYVLTHLPIIDFRPYATGKNITKGMTYKNDGEMPPIHDFSLENSQEELTETILAEEKVMLIIAYNINKADKDSFLPIKEMATKAISKGYSVYGVSASFDEDLLYAQNQYKLPFQFLFCDETTLKTMIRANPGIMILNKGTIVAKTNWVDIEVIRL